ncbi:MAG: hypothetical protein Kow00124_17480 [Anaerolineae bacterium]
MTTRTSRPLSIRSLPIAVKLALVVSALLLVSGLIYTQFSRGLVRRTQDDLAFSQLDTLAESQARRVADALLQELQLVRSLAADSIIQQRLLVARMEPVTSDTATWLQVDPLLNIRLSTLESEHPELIGMSVVTPQGIVLGLEPVPDDLSIDPMQWSWFEPVFDEPGSFAVVPAGTDGLTAMAGVGIAMPVTDPLNPSRVLGVLYTVWDIAQMAPQMSLGGSQEIAVLTRDGRVLLAPAAGSELGSPSAALRSQLSGALRGRFTHTEPGGRSWLYSYTSFAALDLPDPALRQVDWVVLARLPAAAVQASAAVLSSRIQIALLIYSGIMLVLVWVLTRWQLRPLASLTEVASRIEAGQFQAKMPEFPPDEVGRLADVLKNLVNQLVGRVRRLQAAVNISRITVQTLDIDRVLNEVTEALTTHLGYHDARIYLVDHGGKRAWLRAAAGSEGARLLQARHNLAVDETSIVGRSILLSEAQVGQSTMPGRRSRRRAELALPLRSGGQALGALYVTVDGGVLEQEDVDILALIADQVGSSVENARLFEQSTRNLAEIEALNRRLTRQGWEEHLGEAGSLRHTLDPEQRWPEVLEMARQVAGQEARARVYDDEDGRSVLAAPLVLRGETVGTLAVSRPAGEHWTSDEVALLESIATRMAMIAEGIRLVEESTLRAEREQRVNEVSAQLLQRAASVDNVLRTALTELGSALGSETVSLRLGPPPVEEERQIGSGDGSSSRPGMNGDGGVSDVGS